MDKASIVVNSLSSCLKAAFHVIIRALRMTKGCAAFEQITTRGNEYLQELCDHHTCLTIDHSAPVSQIKGLPPTDTGVVTQVR